MERAQLNDENLQKKMHCHGDGEKEHYGQLRFSRYGGTCPQRNERDMDRENRQRRGDRKSDRLPRIR